MSDSEVRPLTALEMARNAAAAVERIAEFQERDPVGSYVTKAGNHGAQAAQLAGQMALVSIAEDLHHIREQLGGGNCTYGEHCSCSCMNCSGCTA